MQSWEWTANGWQCWEWTANGWQSWERTESEGWRCRRAVAADTAPGGAPTAAVAAATAPGQAPATAFAGAPGSGGTADADAAAAESRPQHVREAPQDAEAPQDPEAPQSPAQTKRQKTLECPWMTWYSHPRRPGSGDSPRRFSAASAQALASLELGTTQSGIAAGAGVPAAAVAAAPAPAPAPAPAAAGGGAAAHPEPLSSSGHRLSSWASCVPRGHDTFSDC